MTASNLNQFHLVILPDSTTVTELLLAKLRKFLAGGGKLIASYRGGFDPSGQWSLGSEIPITFAGEEERYPTYWRARPGFNADLSISNRVMYANGLKATPPRGAEILIDRVLPYFKRTDLKFCSHFQTLPSPKSITQHPAANGWRKRWHFTSPIPFSASIARPAISPLAMAGAVQWKN